MAKILIIGASRGIGLETARAALRAGHSIRALARSKAHGAAGVSFVPLTDMQCRFPSIDTFPV
jgi:NAD(P)-dependent dehydrogenase (short-subunit alcohol dehydrogenase family)